MDRPVPRGISIPGALGGGSSNVVARLTRTTVMTRTPKLNDLQVVLLCFAAEREDGSLLPPSQTLGQERSDRIRKAITALLRYSLAEERETLKADQLWREQDGQRIGVFITDAGRTAISAGGDGEVQPGPMAQATDQATALAKEPGAAVNPEPDTAQLDPKSDSKIAHVIALLERPEGATLLELVDATDWLPHTIRAAMTGVRKKGITIERSHRDNTTFWFIPATARDAAIGIGAGGDTAP